MSSVEAWLKDFLVEFRKRYEMLTEEEKSRISNLDNFTPPCQMHFLHFANANFQHLIVTHDKERNDAEITVYGPIPTYEAVDALDSILKDPKWDKELSEEEKSRRLYFAGATMRFRDVLEPIFLNIVNELKNLPFVRPGPTMIPTKSWVTMDSFIWNIRGNIADLDYVEMVNGIMKEAKDRAEAARTETRPPSPAPPKPVIKGSGTYFYPPIWVGKLPKKTFRGQALGSFIFPSKAFDSKYKERVLVVNEDGFIAIGEQDILKATRLLNEIMATGLLLDLPFFAARELEVSEAEIDPSISIITSFGIRMISLRTQLFYEFPIRRETNVPIDKNEVEKEKLVGLIREAERVTQDPELADFLVLLLEAYTCLQSSEYMQSFMMSWVIIERHMFWLWEKFLREENITRTRREKLTSPAYWTADAILESLNLTRQLSLEDYNSLMDLKNKRNSIMHEGERVTRNEADTCFQIARRIVQRRSAIP